MTEELGSIGVGLKVGLGSLDRDIANIEKKVKAVSREWPISFKVGQINTAEIQREIKKITQGKVSVTVTPVLAASAGRTLRTELQSQLKAAGPVRVQVIASLTQQEVRTIRKSVEDALKRSGAVTVPTAGSPKAATVKSTPVSPTVASAPAAATAQAPRRTARPAVARAARSPEDQHISEREFTALPRIADFGGVPTGPSSGVTYRTRPGGETTTARGRTRGTAGYIQQRIDERGNRRVSTDTLRAEKARVRLPETESELEYASRPTKVSLPLDEQAQIEAERRGRGVRGARRSGARERGEPTLTAAEREAQGIIAEDIESGNAAARGAEIRKPGRRSRAYYGSREGVGRLGPIMSKLQFYKFDPVLGAAFEALQAGELGEARGLLQGFASKLSGADPRQRRKFFKLFRNVENVPPELLEKDAALRALYFDVARQIDPEIVNANIGRGGSGRGRQRGSGRRGGDIDAAILDLNTGVIDREEFYRRFPHLKPPGREGGGPVRGFGEPSRMKFAWEDKDPHVFESPYRSDAPREALDRLGAIAERLTQLHPIARKEMQEGMLAGGSGYGPLNKELAALMHEQEALHEQWKRREGGGLVEGPLQRRLRLAREKKYLVGEKRPETYISDSGMVEIVGEHGPEVRSFPESGKIEPRVPEWVRRGLAKDFTGRAREAGGPVYQMRGARGPRAATAQRLASGIVAGGDITRVFVVNWPAGARSFLSSPIGASRAAGPMRFASDKDAEKFAKELGGHIGRQLKDLLPDTEELKVPKEPLAETRNRQALSPLEALESRLGAGETARDLRERQLAIRSAVSEVQQQIPVRSLAPAFGQISATVFGGRGEALARLNKARDLTDQAAKAAGIYGSELKKLNDLETRRKKGEEGLGDAIDEQTLATKRAGDNAKDLTAQAEDATKAADSLGLKLRVLAANTVGIIGGTLAFGATLAVAQAGLTAVAQVISPLIERASGFVNVSAQVTKQLGEQTRAQQGAVQTTVAQREATAGLSAEVAASISPLLQQRAIIEGGNAAFSDQLDLLHTARNLQREERAGAAGAPTGPFQPPGGVPGITRATGGAFGTPVGATPSLFEQVSGEAGQQPLQQIVRGISSALFGQGPTDLTNLLGANPVLSPSETVKMVQDELAKGGDITKIGAAVAPALQLADSLEAMRTGLDKVNSDFEIVGSTSEKFNERLHQQSNTQLALNGVSKELIESFDKLGGIAVINRRTGEAISSRADFKQAFEDVLRSSTIPDPKLLIKQLTERVIPAARDQFAAEGRLQRVTNRAQFALQEAAQPTPGLGGIPFGGGITGRGDEAAKQAARAYKTEVGGAVNFVNEQIKAGRQELIDLVPANLRAEFTGILNDITATGKAISNIQIGIQQEQTNLAVAEYNNQLRIARRSLQDAKDLQAGLNGETRNTLGGLEGQNIALQRQLQLLGFELQQRQINFRLATAGFVAPGTTPEERAARIEAAKIEAAFAQKQLDLQKQIAANQFKGIQITVSRDVTDLLAQINLLQQGREVTIHVAAASRALDILNKKQQLLLAQAGTYIEEGVKITQAAISAAAEVRRQTGAGFAYLLSQTANAWGIFGKQAQAILNALTGSAPTPHGASTGGGGLGAASGLIGDTLGPTNITMGEAGKERVAILKNPKLVPSSQFSLAQSGGSTGPTIQLNVYVTGNSVRSDADLDALAERIGTKVEQKFMQKTSLFGLRGRV